MNTELAKYIFEFHSTWPDVASSVAAYAFIVALVYVWRTTRKK